MDRDHAAPDDPGPVAGAAPPQPPELPELVPLPEGRVLEIRPTTAADADLLARLYRELSPADLHRRFFTASHPGEELCRRWAAIGEHGGFGVVALVRDGDRPADTGDGDTIDDTDTGDTIDDVARDDLARDDDARDGATGWEVVAEAGYSRRSDGDGDFAVTVAPAWRGGLGAYLLDLLVRHAAAAGITALQADVLLENAPMLAVLRHRGAVALEHPDGAIRMTIGTAADVPSWAPEEDRPRVLVEVGGGRWSGEPAADTAGLATALCAGPGRRGGHPCPVLEGGRCPLADGADAIVVLLDPADEVTERIIAEHRRQSPDTPLFVRRVSDATDATDATGAGGSDGGGTCRAISPTGKETVAEILSLIGPPGQRPDPGTDPGDQPP